ncbi:MULTISPECIES: DUF6578 domain-containing protein [Tsukamurella]|uniref:Uncharacterized protein n=2 Tax=Tsukamurella TaxID=2060 RepID=A0A5C5RWQ8_9ACTN|nr:MULTISPECIES: DUF6578 domain-containing protein [Tsukamurella]NMD56592.1 hypothetical protein [Tsukamurella columbiensis]TWS27477.1 hypothetical protein FK530_18340 [Tsukamurella conjunctivitidis]
MNTPSSYDDSLLYVHIDTWEYQCCGTAPRVGAELSGTLTVYRSELPGHRAPEVTGFDPRTGLVHLGSTVAQLGHGLSEPDGELLLALGWHESDARPAVTGIIERVVEETGRFLPIGEDRTLLVDPDSREFHDVDEATRWPEEQLESGGAATIGVVVGLRVTELRIPTDAEIEERLADEERAERTLHLTGPTECFGSAVPREGDCIVVDLSDRRLDKGGVLAHLTRVVRGEVLQASAMSAFGRDAEIFGVLYTEPDPNDPPTELMVRLLVEPDDVETA